MRIDVCLAQNKHFDVVSSSVLHQNTHTSNDIDVNERFLRVQFSFLYTCHFSVGVRFRFFFLSVFALLFFDSFLLLLLFLLLFNRKTFCCVFKFICCAYFGRRVHCFEALCLSVIFSNSFSSVLKPKIHSNVHIFKGVKKTNALFSWSCVLCVCACMSVYFKCVTRLPFQPLTLTFSISFHPHAFLCVTVILISLHIHLVFRNYHYQTKALNLCCVYAQQHVLSLLINNFIVVLFFFGGKIYDHVRRYWYIGVYVWKLDDGMSMFVCRYPIHRNSDHTEERTYRKC